jgi:P4 family phage/plasmid primase-like protien
MDEDGEVWRLAKATAIAISQEHVAEAVEAATELRREENLEPSDQAEIKRLRAIIRTANAKADQIQTERRIATIIKLARSDSRVVIDRADLDADPWILNTQSGIVDLVSGDLRPHDPAALCTRITAAEYDPDATSDELARCLDAATGGDPEIAEYLRLTLGNSLLGNNRLEKFFLCVGPGGSGKGTLFEAAKDTLGDYCATSEFQTWIRTPGARIRDDLARLDGPRLVLSSETEKSEALAASVIKAMTGGDTITCRQLYGTYFEFRPRFTLWLQANDKPRVDDADSGIWRRLVCIPFGNTVPEDQRDPAIKEALQNIDKSGAAILAWLVSGCIETAKAKRIEMPTAVKSATTSYNAEMNPIADFLADVVRLASEENYKITWAPVKDVNKAYEQWATEERIDRRYQLGQRALGKRLEALGRIKVQKKIDGKNAKYWLGLTLPQTESDEHPDQWGSWRVSEAEHRQVLGGNQVTEVTGDLKSPHTRDSNQLSARTRARPTTSSDSGYSGYPVTSEEKQNQEPIQETDIDLPDFDDDEAPF